MVATEPAEVQVRVEDEDPGVNTSGLVMMGIATGKEKIDRRQYSVAERVYF